MSRDWKPGDVAMVLNEHGVWNRAICAVRPHGVVWAYGVADSWSRVGADARPLVVIDPEDSVQVERFRRVLGKYVDVQDAESVLRRLVTPPKPDEPTGLGAVVEDEAGIVWVLAPKNAIGDTEWVSEHSTNGRWDHIDAVKVLSEGVTP